MDKKKIFSAWIKRQRLARSLTQKEFGKLLGLTQASVSQWEVGDSYPEPAQLKAISKTLGISIDEITGQSEAPSDLRSVIREEVDAALESHGHTKFRMPDDIVLMISEVESEELWEAFRTILRPLVTMNNKGKKL